MLKPELFTHTFIALTRMGCSDNLKIKLKYYRFRAIKIYKKKGR